MTFVDNGNGTGTLGGTPAAGTGGTYALTFTATNGVGRRRSQAFTLTVNQAPAITSATATTFTVGRAGTFTVTTTASRRRRSSRGGALPAGVTFVDNGNGTGTLSGTPARGHRRHLCAHLHRHQRRRLERDADLHADGQRRRRSPAQRDHVHGRHARHVHRHDHRLPASRRSRAAGALPAGVTFIDNGNGTATLAGTPAAGTGGIYALTFTAANGVGARRPQTFTLTVNQAPAITSATATTFTVGVPGTFTVTTTGLRRRRRSAVTGDAAGGRHVHRQRQRHRDAGRHAGGGDRRQLPADHHRHNGVGQSPRRRPSR